MTAVTSVTPNPSKSSTHHSLAHHTTMMDGDEDPQPSELTTAVINGMATSVTVPPSTVVAAAPPATSPLSESTHEKLPPLAEILYDTEHFHQIEADDGAKTRVKCMWCNHVMPLHATKVLHHAARVANKGVKICTGVVPKAHRDRYQDLHEKKLGKANQKASKLARLCSFSCVVFIVAVVVRCSSKRC